jgi:hypothetical protein
VEEIDDPTEMWMVLAARMYAAGTVVGRMTILRKFHALRPIAGQPINTYFSRLLEVKNQLAGSAQAISDAEFQNHLYTSLPSMFDVIVEILQARTDPTIQKVLDALKEHEQNHTMTVKPDSVSEALYSQQGGNQRGRGGRGANRGRGNYHGKERSQKWCDECKKGTHMTADCWYNEKNNKRTHDQGTNGCYYCGEEGHIQYNYLAKRKGNALRNNRASQPQGVNQGTRDTIDDQQ